jgi:aspartate 1-decarboxylase
VGLLPRERILVGNMRNGERFETYVIEGKPGSRDVVLNGATAHLGKKGDLLTVMSFAILTPREAKKFRPRVIVMEPAGSR